MKKSLEQIREKWEKGLTLKLTLDLEYNTLVILQNDKTKDFYAHRYFLMAGDWTCSVDKSEVSLDEIFSWLEYMAKD